MNYLLSAQLTKQIAQLLSVQLMIWAIKIYAAGKHQVPQAIYELILLLIQWLLMNLHYSLFDDNFHSPSPTQLKDFTLLPSAIQHTTPLR